MTTILQWTKLTTLVLIPIVLSYLALEQSLVSLPVWSEERGWIEIAQRVARGEITDPFLPKRDFPSSFQAWPIAFLIKIGSDPIIASRLTGFAYIVGASVIVFCLVRFYRPSAMVGAISAQVIYLFSQMAMGPVPLGWHEITIVPLLGFGSWYYLLRYSRDRSWRTALPASVFIGLSLWTLYTPALVAISLVLSFMVGRNWRTKEACVLLIGTFLIAMPVGWRIVSSKGAVLNRHHQWYLKGGEWTNAQYGAPDGFWSRMGHNSHLLSSSLLPSTRASETINESVLPRLEFPLGALVFVGFLTSLATREGRRYLLLPSFLIGAGVLLSNPTPWRLSVVSVPVGMFLIAGVAQLLKRRHGVWLVVGMAYAQVVFFSLRWLETLEHVGRRLAR